MDKMLANAYGSLCMYHHKECALFCPICIKFLCAHCHDDHFNTGSILNAPQIKCVLEEMMLDKNVKSITKSIQELENSYQLALKKLNQNFNIITNGIKSVCNLQSHALSNEAKQELEELLKINELKSEITQQIQQKEKKIYTLYCHGKLFIEQIYSLLIAIPTKIEQYNQDLSKIATSEIPQPTKQELPDNNMKKLILRRTIDQLPTKFIVEGPTLKREQSMPLDMVLPTNYIIHYWKNNTITLFNPVNKIKKNIQLNKPINDRADSIAFKNRIFIMGGLVTDEVYEVDIYNKVLIPKSSMLCKKCHHSLCADDNAIYSIGGNNNTSLPDCEKYVVDDNTWSKLPDLINARRLCATFMWEQCLYAFAGYGNTNLNSMEKLVLEGSHKWEEVAIKNSPTARCEVHGIPVKEGVLIVGGHCNSDYLYQY